MPEVRDRAWVRNPIDAFVLSRLEEEGFRPAPEADRATLIRRLSFDLIGLPPAPEDVADFVADPRPDAYEELVDRLLASPHFGERWGRHWLDLARYADSDGYEKDNVRPYAYLYRDWVIDAINADMSFDQFTLHQIAGDLLPNATLEQKIATGFHRQTLTNREGGVDQEEFRCKATVDRVNTTGTIWLGLTIGCAECHSHKYDPISQREYYKLYAFFNDMSEQDVPAPQPDELAAYDRAKRLWDRELTRLQGVLDRFLEEELPERFEQWEQSTPADLPDLPPSIQTILGIAAADRDDEQREALLSFYRDSVDSQAQELKAKLEQHAEGEPKYPPTVAAVVARADPSRETRIHIRGDFLRQGDRVEPGTPEVLHPLNARGVAPDRIDLARWLVDPANPLTARVTVNRVWDHLFGRGLSTTLGDFGTRSESPSHPELLDWLAVEFQRLNWSRKALIRLIVNSSAYRQSSAYRPELAQRDPNNRLLAAQNRFRLEAEAVRDASLAASGLLSSVIGGPSVRPPLPSDIAALGYANQVKWRESGGADRYRRGLYILWQRTVPYPMLVTFDAPDGVVTCTRRERSNTPIQALTLLNDPVFVECAEALGKQLTAEEYQDSEALIRRAFEICLSRAPRAPEMKRLQEFYDHHLLLAQQAVRSTARGSDSDGDEVGSPEALTRVALARVLMNLDQFVTRE